MSTTSAWSGNKRSDGLAILLALNGNWIILPADESAIVDVCPVCQLPLYSHACARRLADAVFPLGGRPL